MKIKDNENVKINNHNNKKENVKIIIIIIMKSIITIMIKDIENQIETVNRNKDMKNDKNIKEINDKKLIIKRIWNNKKNDIKNKNENINIKIL